MATEKLVLTLSKETYRDLKKKSGKLKFKAPQQFVYDLIRKELYARHAGGRPKEKSFEEEFEDKFSTPTKKSRKIGRWARKYNIGW